MTITSKNNEKLKLARKLAERKHREREGLFVTEGEDLLEAGRSAGLEPDVLLTRAGEGLGGDEVDAALLDAASALGSGTRAIAIWPLPAIKRPTRPGIEGHAGRSREQEGSRRALHVYLHGVGDPGNVGSIVRSAGALADAWVALGPDCADPFGPKAVRASMGAIFSVPVTHCEIADTPAPRVSLVTDGGAPTLREGARTLCLGSERDGLPPEVISASDATWTIPMRSDAVESLGVAAAAAIALSRIGSRVGEE
ncbi:MAG: RNA methyltransferase [Actinomycetota bacterium]|nr:RNA methyltransferase [Actinomycetota bacterium]